MQRNSPKDYFIESNKLNGFYRGVVEDNIDPEKAGRVRVRIFGVHTEKINKIEIEGIPVDELPWAEPCMPIVEGSVSGFGVWGIPLQGSHVMLFFENGNVSQPRYFASMPGIPESKLPLSKRVQNIEKSASKKEGFRDPDGKYPVDSKLGEPDVHRLARGESKDTLVDTKNENLDQAIQVAYGGSWDEPPPAYDAVYPHNFVFTTHGGLTVELDSTPGAKRFHIYHPSNTYIECDNEGNLVIRNQGDKYEIVMQSKNIHIINDRNITVDADERAKVKGNKFTEINEDEDRRVDGDRRTEIRGSDTEVVGGNLTVTVSGNITLVSPSTTITGGSVRLGAQATMRKLMDDRTIGVFNTHTHSQSNDGAGDVQAETNTPSQSLSTGQVTSNVEGS